MNKPQTPESFKQTLQAELAVLLKMHSDIVLEPFNSIILNAHKAHLEEAVRKARANEVMGLRRIAEEQYKEFETPLAKSFMIYCDSRLSELQPHNKESKE